MMVEVLHVGPNQSSTYYGLTIIMKGDRIIYELS